MWFQDGCVGGKVGRGAGVGLDVDAPKVGVQAEGAQCPFLAQQLDLIHDLCAAVVPGEETQHHVRVRLKDIVKFCTTRCQRLY